MLYVPCRGADNGRMTELLQVPVGTLPTERFKEVLPEDRYEEFVQAINEAVTLFEGRAIWNVNSTPYGGGVAEMLRSLLAYTRAIGIDSRWTVISGNPEFFAVTKRIHNFLHGSPGDGGDLGEREREIYEAATAPNAAEFGELVAPQDVVLIHDPQPAGLIKVAKEAGATVLWRCHVGLDKGNDYTRKAWNFLLPYVRNAEGYVFSRREYVWDGLDTDRVTVIAPSIDAFSPKNQELSAADVAGILAASATVSNGASHPATFTREDGSVGRIERQTVYYDGGPPPPADARQVVQVSRWDRLKDPVGVIEGFARFVAPHTDAHLILAGPSVEAVADDPEGAEVLDESKDAWSKLPEDVRARIHLATLPMEDGEENAAIVNAIQRNATVVVQKSLAEGFGLTVSEAMWKARPVVASKTGGIQDQIVHGESGLLVNDARDLEEFGAAVKQLLDDPEDAERMGKAAQERVRDMFLGPRHLMQYSALMAPLLH